MTAYGYRITALRAKLFVARRALEKATKRLESAAFHAEHCDREVKSLMRDIDKYARQEHAQRAKGGGA